MQPPLAVTNLLTRFPIGRNNCINLRAMCRNVHVFNLSIQDPSQGITCKHALVPHSSFVKSLAKLNAVSSPNAVVSAC